MSLTPENESLQGNTRQDCANDPAHDFKRVVRHYMEQAKHFSAITDHVPLFPQLIQIEPTNACNLRCVHCHHHRPSDGTKPYTRPLGMMDMAIYHKIIDEIAPKKTAISLNVQGEPTLHPKFLDMVAYAKGHGLHTSVLTNGTRLTEELTESLLDLGLDRIVFSFDAVDETIYESIRIKSKFRPTLTNILRFIKMNHERGHQTHVCMSMVEQDRNRHHAAKYEQYFNRLPVDKVFRNPMLNLAGASGTQEEIDLASLQHGARSDWPVCRIAWEYLTVNWDGKVGPCPVDVNVIYSLGNVKDRTLEELWNCERMKQFRRAHIDKDYSVIEEDGPLCGSCNCLWDPDYDLRRFGDYTVDAIYRSAVQFAHHFQGKEATDSDQKYQNLVNELAGLETVLHGA